jgi:septum formation protein
MKTSRTRPAPRLLLASASPRRAELLALLGLPFEVRISQVPEEPEDVVMGRRLDQLEPEDLAATLAEAKARDVLERYGSPGCLALGADTIVVKREPGRWRILAKPRDADDARAMLRLLSGAEHDVMTGVSLARAIPRDPAVEADTRVVRTKVRFRALTDEMIDAYVSTGDPMDKAGAYGIQSGAAPFVESLEGDYFNVVGLPVHTVALMLERAGVRWWECAAAGA